MVRLPYNSLLRLLIPAVTKTRDCTVSVPRYYQGLCQVSRPTLHQTSSNCTKWHILRDTNGSSTFTNEDHHRPHKQPLCQLLLHRHTPCCCVVLCKDGHLSSNKYHQHYVCREWATSAGVVSQSKGCTEQQPRPTALCFEKAGNLGQATFCKNGTNEMFAWQD